MRSILMKFVLACALIGAPVAAVGQAYKPGTGTTDQNPPPVKLQCWNGSAYAACAAGSGGGDASAANQTATQANPGSDAVKATAVQGVTGGKAIPVTDAGGSFTVDTGTPGTFAITGSVTGSITGAAANGAAVSGNPVLMAGYDGTNSRTILTDTGGKVQIASVTGGQAANGAVSNPNPFVVAGYDGANVRSLSTGVTGILNVAVPAGIIGNVADAVADSLAPLKVGTRIQATPVSGTTGNRADMVSDQYRNLKVAPMGTGVSPANGMPMTLGIQFVQTGSTGTGPLMVLPMMSNGTTLDMLPGNTSGLVTQPFAVTSLRWNYAAAAGGITNTSTAVTFIAAAGAGIRNYVASIQLDAGTLGAATEVAIRDGAGGTVLWRILVGTAGISRTVNFTVPLKGTANTLMEVVTLTPTVTGPVYYNAQGYQAN